MRREANKNVALIALAFALIACILCLVKVSTALSIQGAESIREDLQSDDDDANLLSLVRRSKSVNNNLFAVNHPIEMQYIAEGANKTGDTQGMVIFYQKYKELWKDELEKYAMLVFEELSDYNSGEQGNDVLMLFENYQQAWDALLTEGKMFYEGLENQIFNGGTIVRQNIERDEMMLYRSRALEMMYIYSQVMTGRGWSWKYEWQQ